MPLKDCDPLIQAVAEFGTAGQHVHNRRMSLPNAVSALTIAGSDSGGGAGVQADLKTFAAHRVHGLCAITALTAQHTRNVNAVHVPPLDFLKAQMDACFADFNIQGVKLGMLATADVIHCVADALERHRPAFVVLDPVIAASSGAVLLESAAVDALRKRLFPMATLLTPNIPEAELLLGYSIKNAQDAEHAMTALLASGANAVLLKGGHLHEGKCVIDRFDDGVTQSVFTHPRLDVHTHGTGCTLSAAITAQLCQGIALADACQAGIDYIVRALGNGYYPGRSNTRVLDHVGAGRQDRQD